MKSISNKNSLLSLSNTNLLRVVFEVLVLIHHLYLTSTSLGSVISGALGPIAVGGFIFLSGYGVALNFIKKQDEYAKKLIKSRIPRTYAILLIADLCYLALYLATGGKFADPFSAVVSVLYLPVFSGFVPLSHWIYFLADIIVYYAMFLLFVFIFKKTKNRLFWTAISILILDLIIIAVLSAVNYHTGSMRYLRGCLCFPIGLLCALFCDKLAEIIKKYRILLAVGLSLISIILMVFVNYRPITEYILPVLTVIIAVAILHGVNTECGAVTYLSGLVLYVYVSHEFFLLLCRHLLSNMQINLHNNLIALIVFALSSLFAILMNAIVKSVGKIKLSKVKNIC